MSLLCCSQQKIAEKSRALLPAAQRGGRQQVGAGDSPRAVGLRGQRRVQLVLQGRGGGLRAGPQSEGSAWANDLLKSWHLTLGLWLGLVQGDRWLLHSLSVVDLHQAYVL